ncbi:5349_t:CDS:2 [Gigaspora rosea]|nr:5349_t:CDS:2 [Gigaspora rosea]
MNGWSSKLSEGDINIIAKVINTNLNPAAPKETSQRRTLVITVL